MNFSSFISRRGLRQGLDPYVDPAHARSPILFKKLKLISDTGWTPRRNWPAGADRNSPWCAVCSTSPRSGFFFTR